MDLCVLVDDLFFADDDLYGCTSTIDYFAYCEAGFSMEYLADHLFVLNREVRHDR